MLNTNPERLAQVAQETFDACTSKRDAARWQTAIAKAMRQLEENPFIHLDSNGILILSDSNEI